MVAPVCAVHETEYEPDVLELGAEGAGGVAGAVTVTLVAAEYVLQPAALQARTWYCHVPTVLPDTLLLVADPL